MLWNREKSLAPRVFMVLLINLQIASTAFFIEIATLVEVCGVVALLHISNIE